MLHRLYKAFIQPKQQDEDLANRELVLNVLLIGTIAIICLALVLLIGSYSMGFTYVGNRIVGLGIALLFVLAVYELSRLQRYHLAAYLLLSMYVVLAAAVAASWGVTMPSAILLFGLIIIISGILLGAKFAPYAACVVILLIVGLKILETDRIIQPDLTWAKAPLDFGIIIGCCIIFGIMALITWLFNVRMEHSLRRAKRAELGLKRQKMLLETKVEERTRQLQAAQLERVQQLYRFAELGQLSTALLHDLANHLTTLTLDIEGLQDENRSQVLKRAKRSIRYIDDMVLRVRDQLHGKTRIRAFDVGAEVNEVVSLLTHKATAARVNLKIELLSDKQRLRCRGETIRFRQLIANMISNAVDAYDEVSGLDAEGREVLLSVEAVKKQIVITVADWGRGIKPEERDKLFEPFYSTKKTGMGMGLFIAKQIAEEHFGGAIRLNTGAAHTAFIISLPKA